MPALPSCDITILGGGLSGCLIALALAEKRPELDVRIVEAGSTLGGNHLWSFFDHDVAAEHRWLVEPLIAHRWVGYDVHFPKHSRGFDVGYNSITSERLDAVVRGRIAPERIIRADADAPLPFTARQTIDARGPGDLSTLECGWQKFVGMNVHVPGGHGLSRPIVMDANVEQIDGYRFVYCLPLDAETVFIEDTYYSDTPDLDAPALEARIIAYAAAKGWHTNGGGRVETGVLPVVMGGDFQAYWRSTGETGAKAGLRAGLFQATTGYSLPDAVRLAVAFADNPQLDIRALAEARWAQQRFNRLLDTMLFRAAEPEQRYKVLERFYTLSPALIGRFYAGQNNWAEKLRILSGKPPVPITAALRAISGLTWL